MPDASRHPPKRSSGALRQRRVPLPWPKDRDFRILSIDGGGIRGIFPAVFLAGLEERYLNGRSVAGCFDLVAGTSTGGVLAIGLGAGLTAADLSELYISRGGEIFPPPRSGLIGRLQIWARTICSYAGYRYDRHTLMQLLHERLGDRKFGESMNRLCVPSFDGRHGEVYIFKTPHHPDFRSDAREPMTKVAAATAAAPTYFRPLEEGGYIFVDGGVWASNPVMIALVDALSCFDIPRERIRILSLGCGDDPYTVDREKIVLGGMFAWRDIIFAAMRLQSLNALGQAGLLVGPENVLRVDAPANHKEIKMDDWRRAKEELPEAAREALQVWGGRVADTFLSDPATAYKQFADDTLSEREK
ncbi:CBASS cGAMP-activated phospholipase [Marinibaculum pumilum]|uniref:CBASS cGAMP-activated phospholipase n=1 Tax=Marinibaculum pumilum TaxID=1766165 RepID=A0ABV7L716_9PROT